MLVTEKVTIDFHSKEKVLSMVNGYRQLYSY